MVENKTPNLQKWFRIDGPQDSIWIENLNTVLDDSKVFCLTNGERIKLNNTIKMIFETDSIANNSPATISRLGFVYIMNDTITYKNFLNLKFSKIKPEQKLQWFIYDFLIKNLDAIFQFTKQFQLSIPISDLTIIQTFLIFLEFCMSQLNFEATQNINNIMKQSLIKILYFSLCWGFGSCFNDLQQRKLNYKQNHEINVFNSYLKFQNNTEGEFIFFKTSDEVFQYDKSKSFEEIIIPTPYIMCYQYITNIFASQNEHLYLIGSPGSGKSMLIQYSLQKMTNFLHQRILFCNNSTIINIQQKLDTFLISSRKNRQVIMSPPQNQKCIFMIDDLNLPELDKGYAQPPIEFLRQILDQKFYIDGSNIQKKYVQNIILFCISSYPGGGRQQITQRFSRFLHHFNLDQMDDKTISYIYSEILNSFMKQLPFKNEIKSQIQSIIESTLQLTNQLKQKIICSYKTPHYIFSTRDMSNIIKGILQAVPMTIDSPYQFKCLWYHEATRVFSDRLVSEKDRVIFTEMIKKIGIQNLNEQINLNELYQINFLHAQMGKERLYELIQNFDKLKYTINNLMQLEPDLQLILFKDVCDHIARITRIIQFCNGHMMIVGGQGQGKRSITKLASYIIKAKFQLIHINQKFNLKNFRADLFNCMLETVREQKQMICMIYDDEEVEQNYFMDINNYLSNMDILGIISQENIETIKLEFSMELNPLQYFLKQLKFQFHIVLGISPICEGLYKSMRLFPGLCQLFIINWMTPQPYEAYYQIAYKTFEGSTLNKQNLEKIENMTKVSIALFQLTKQMATTYQNRDQRQIYVTFKNFIDFVNYYSKYIQEQKNNVNQNINKIQYGLDKLLDSNATIIQLKNKLLELQPILIKQTADMKEMIAQLNTDQQEANIVKKLVQKEANEVNQQQEKISIMKQEADLILKEAQPIFNQAVQQLEKLNRSDISELKSNNNPHVLVKFAVECLAIVLDQPTDWESCRKIILSDTSLLSKLKNINCENISPVIVGNLKRKLASNSQFIPQELQKINQAAKSMCEWVHAVTNFTGIYAEIITKRKNCQLLDQQLNGEIKKLEVKQNQLDNVISKLIELENTYKRTKKEKEALDIEVKQAEERLIRANQLTEGLSDEKIRWKKKIDDFNIELENIEGNSIIICLDIFFMGPFPQDLRKQLRELYEKKMEQMSLYFTQNIRLDKILSSQKEIQNWQQHGLSKDETSLANGIYTLKSVRTPIIIDPQKQAFKWLVSLFSNQDVQICKSFSDQLIKILQNSLKLGKPLIIEDLSDLIPSCLQPILREEYHYSNNQKFIQIDDQQFEVSNGFKIFLVCSKQNPHYLPNTIDRASIVNFQVTKQALYNKLMSLTVSRFLPEDELIRTEMAEKIQHNTVIIQMGEDKLLDLLSNSRGIILDDIELIDSLKISKENSRNVLDQMMYYQQKEIEIQKNIHKFQPIAKRGMNLFFFLLELPKLNPLYDYSINYFVDLYNEVLNDYESIDIDIQKIIENLTYKFIRNIQIGLFNEHKKVFIFLTSVYICIYEYESVDIIELEQLTKSSIQQDQICAAPQSLPITQDQWNSFYALHKLIQSYQVLIQDIQHKSVKWIPFFTSSNMIHEKPPTQIEDFQLLMLVSRFQPQHLLESFDCFVKIKLGEKALKQTQMSFHEIANSLNFKKPLLMITKSGLDPTNIFNQIVFDQNQPSNKITQIPLGQGQNQQAIKILNNAIEKGHWVLLINCHLGKSFLPILEKKLDQISQGGQSFFEYDENFRLFLTSDICDYLPISIKQQSIKVTNEPIGGIKDTMIQFYTNFYNGQKPIDDKYMNKEVRNFIFGLCMFHAVIQERKKFGAVGFTDPYVFNDNDIKQSFIVLEELLIIYREIPFNALQYMISIIIYGGRINDDWDMRILKYTYQMFCNEKCLQTKYQYSTNQKYQSPDQEDFYGVIQYLSSLDNQDQPEIFGLSLNVDIMYYLKQTNNVIDFIKSTLTSQNMESQNQTYIDTLKQLYVYTQNKIPDQIDLALSKLNPTDSIDNFAQIEINKMNNLIKLLKVIFDDLNQAIQGKILMTYEQQIMSDDLYNGKVPQQIIDKSYPSLKPIYSWITELLKRHQFFKSWVNQGKPHAFLFSAFFFPQGLIVNLLQIHSRKVRKSMDQVQFKFIINEQINLESIQDHPFEGCYIYGLYSEGFLIENNSQNKILINQNKHKQVYFAAPVIHLIPNIIGTEEIITNLHIPIYKTTNRTGTLTTNGTSTNYIMGIYLFTSIELQKWILAGVALFCQEPY